MSNNNPDDNQIGASEIREMVNVFKDAFSSFKPDEKEVQVVVQRTDEHVQLLFPDNQLVVLSNDQAVILALNLLHACEVDFEIEEKKDGNND